MDSEELVTCIKGCNRSFKRNYILKHMEICERTFQKRTPFISQLKRAGDISQKREILEQLRTPKVEKQITSPRIATVFCKGCLRDFNPKVAVDHISKCVQRQQKKNF